MKSPSRGSHQSINGAFIPSPLGTPVKLRKSTPVQLSGMAKVLPIQSRSADNSPSSSPKNTPVPKPRLSVTESSAKLAAPRLTENRFSTVFVPYNPPPIKKDSTKPQPVARPRLQIPEAIPEAKNSENHPSAVKSLENIEERRSYISAKSNSTSRSSKSAINLPLRHLVESAEVPSSSSFGSETTSDSNADDSEKIGTWVRFGDDKGQKDSDLGRLFSATGMFYFSLNRKEACQFFELLS